MANRREASDVENQAEGSVAGHCKLANTKALYALIEGVRDEQGKFFSIWRMIFVLSCVFAVSLDPLFFYILNIDQDNMCLQMDKRLRNTVFLLRSLTDIIFVVPFIYKIYNGAKVQMHKKLDKRAILISLRNETSIRTRGNLYWKSKGRVLNEVGKKIAQKMMWLSFSIINDFLALLPVPQLLIVFTFYHMRGPEYVEHIKVLNAFLLGQYLPRIYRIRQSSNELRKNAGIWVKSLFNFFLYMLASHILGAFWYFFSIQQETSCWHSACAKYSPDPIECMNTFYCGHQTTTSRNITFLNKHCPLYTQDGALPPFNFGIFLDSLKIQKSGQIKFGNKFFYSFWWGLRNLSNFGTNLTTSMYVWENLFAVLISVVGLLLFIYLIGNVQTFVQMKATKTEEMRQKKEGDEETKQKIKMKMLNVSTWIYKNKFPHQVKKEIINSIEKILKKDDDAYVDKPFLILPSQTRRSVKRFLFMDTLKTVKKLEDMDNYVLALMCDYLNPVTYIENSFVFRTGDPLNCMLFILEGTIWTFVSSDSQDGNGIPSMATKPLGKGDFYGEELLDWASNCFTKVPVSSRHVKTQTKVKAFVLMAQDLETVISRCRLQWENKGSLAKHMAASTIAAAFRGRFHKPFSPATPPVDTTTTCCCCNW